MTKVSNNLKCLISMDLSLPALDGISDKKAFQWKPARNMEHLCGIWRIWMEVFAPKQTCQTPESRLQMHALIIRLLAVLRACVRFRIFFFSFVKRPKTWFNSDWSCFQTSLCFCFSVLFQPAQLITFKIIANPLVVQPN